MARPNDVRMQVNYRKNLWLLYAEEPGDYTSFLEVRHDFSKDPD